MGLVKSLWVVGGENPSHRGEEWAKLYARRRYNILLRTLLHKQCRCHARFLYRILSKFLKRVGKSRTARHLE